MLHAKSTWLCTVFWYHISVKNIFRRNCFAVPSFFFASCFFPFVPLQVMLSIFSSRGSIVLLMLWKKADSCSENRFGAISQLRVDNRTPNSFWSVVIRGPSTILRPKCFLQFNWWKRSSRRGDGFPILPFFGLFRFALLLLRRSSEVFCSVVKPGDIQCSPEQTRQCIRVSLSVERRAIYLCCVFHRAAPLPKEFAIYKYSQ